MRGKDLLVELNQELTLSSSNRAQRVREFTAELRKETTEQHALRGFFKKTAGLLNYHNVDLGEERQRHALEAGLNALLQGEHKGLFLRVLRRRDRLKAIPEIHWRVNRGMQEYNERFGLDTHCNCSRRQDLKIERKGYCLN